MIDRIQGLIEGAFPSGKNNGALGIGMPPGQEPGLGLPDPMWGIVRRLSQDEDCEALHAGEPFIAVGPTVGRSWFGLDLRRQRLGSPLGWKRIPTGIRDRDGSGLENRAQRH